MLDTDGAPILDPEIEWGDRFATPVRVAELAMNRKISVPKDGDPVLIDMLGRNRKRYLPCFGEMAKS